MPVYWGVLLIASFLTFLRCKLHWTYYVYSHYNSFIFHCIYTNVENWGPGGETFCILEVWPAKIELSCAGLCRPWEAFQAQATTSAEMPNCGTRWTMACHLRRWDAVCVWVVYKPLLHGRNPERYGLKGEQNFWDASWRVSQSSSAWVLSHDFFRWDPNARTPGIVPDPGAPESFPCTNCGTKSGSVLQRAVPARGAVL